MTRGSALLIILLLEASGVDIKRMKIGKLTAPVTITTIWFDIACSFICGQIENVKSMRQTEYDR